MIQNTPGAGNRESAEETDQEERYLPARMINEFVYCPRLFYLMHVEGQFEHNTETTDGEHVHRRVDARTDALAAPRVLDQQPIAPEVAQQQLLFESSLETVELSTEQDLSNQPSVEQPTA